MSSDGLRLKIDESLKQFLEKLNQKIQDLDAIEVVTAIGDVHYKLDNINPQTEILNTIPTAVTDGVLKLLARTRIELDADILTILRPDFLIISRANTFLVLHNLNVNLANNLFKRRLYNLFNSIKALINTARIVANGNIDTQSLIQLIVLILDLVGGPYVLVRFLPNIIGRIILCTIQKELHF